MWKLFFLRIFRLATSESSSLPSGNEQDSEDPEATDGSESRGQEAWTRAVRKEVCHFDDTREYSGTRRKQKFDQSDEILINFVEVTQECDAKRKVQGAELENQRREQERNHEERMKMMMTFLQQSHTHSPQHNFAPKFLTLSVCT